MPAISEAAAVLSRASLDAGLLAGGTGGFVLRHRELLVGAVRSINVSRARR